MHATMRLTLGFMLLAAVALGGCHHSTSTAPAPASDPGIAGPMNEKERMESEQWAKSTAGIDLESSSGLIEVEAFSPRDEAEAARHLAEADALFATNRVMEAMEQYGLAARQNPDLADAYVGLGRMLKRKGKLDPAAAAFRTAIDRDDRHLEARYQLAMVLWTPTQHEEAIAEMNAILIIDPEYGKAHERLAVWNYYVAEYDAAAAHAERADELGHPVPEQFAAMLKAHLDTVEQVRKKKKKG